MMRYFIDYNEMGYICAVGIGPGGVEVSESEYNDHLSIMHRKLVLMEQLYRGVISDEEIPAEWREEINWHVSNIIAIDGEYRKDDVDDALAILRGEVSE